MKVNIDRNIVPNIVPMKLNIDLNIISIKKNIGPNIVPMNLNIDLNIVLKLNRFKLKSSCTLSSFFPCESLKTKNCETETKYFCLYSVKQKEGDCINMTSEVHLY